MSVRLPWLSIGDIPASRTIDMNRVLARLRWLGPTVNRSLLANPLRVDTWAGIPMLAARSTAPRPLHDQNTSS